MGEELLHQVALCLIPRIGPVSIRRLISYCGSAREVFHTDPGRLKSIPGIGENIARLILNGGSLDKAREEIDIAKRHQVDLLFYTDPHFPKRLKQIAKAPLLLYRKGNLVTPVHRALGIVGTRKITSYGVEVLTELLKAWRVYNPTIISGLAYGVDITAHRIALEEGLSTVGVLGHGLDMVYPSAHWKTAHQMLKQGGLLSELKFGTKPDTFQFPRRNRIIAGLSDALIVIEAQRTGGALITAEIAKAYQRPVLAIPGPINNSSSLGCLQLIRDGTATMLTTPEELLNYVPWSPQQQATPKIYPELTQEEQRITALLKSQIKGVHIDEISWKTQIPINRVGSLLLNLEFSGHIKCLPGKKFSLVRK